MFSYGYAVCIGIISGMLMGVFCFKVDFEGIITSEFVQVLLHRELTDSNHVLSKQMQYVGYWEA